MKLLKLWWSQNRENQVRECVIKNITLAIYFYFNRIFYCSMNVCREVIPGRGNVGLSARVWMWWCARHKDLWGSNIEATESIMCCSHSSSFVVVVLRGRDWWQFLFSFFVLSRKTIFLSSSYSLHKRRTILLFCIAEFLCVICEML